MQQLSEENKQISMALVEERKYNQETQKIRMDQVEMIKTGITEMKQKLGTFERKTRESGKKDEATKRENSDVNVDYQPPISATLIKKRKQTNLNMEPENKQGASEKRTRRRPKRQNKTKKQTELLQDMCHQH